MNDTIGLSVLAQAAEKVSAAVNPESAAGLTIGQKLLLLLVLCVVPYIVGAFVARALRLREFSNRIGTVLLAFTLGLAPFVYQIAADGDVGSWKKCLRLGIDLAGGTNLIYQAETKAAEEENKDINLAMNRMVLTIQKRINPSGTEEMAVRRVGEDRFEIIIPGADQGVVEQKKLDMVRLGSLEFGIVANARDHRSWITAAQRLPEKIDKLDEGGRIVAVWRDVWPDEDIPRGTAELGTRVLTTRKHKKKNGEEIPVTQVLIVQDAEEDVVNGKYLTRAGIGLAESGQPAVNFSFNAEGAMRFFRLTDRNKPTVDGAHMRQLAIILDGKVHSAPNINSAIRDQGQITGDFDNQELNALVNVLNAGALELPIKRDPIAEFTISPLLGEDVQRKGMLALVVSSLAVFVFMLVYYRFAGVVADISLLLNLVLIIGSMAICNATFTLPGLAGMVLTIGMAVDTNVLIYERMREEKARGSSLRMVIHNGFDKALSAIVDSNITTLIAAVILYMIGTDQIKGFAVTLFIGICMSMFSALYFGHLLFDVAERKRWIRDLSMMKLIGVPKYDFVARMKTAITCSASFIIFGVVLLFARGNESLDIDFSGGSMVTFKFVEPQQIDDVRGKLNTTFQGAISLERLALPDESTTAETGKQFRLRTKEQDINKIRDGISKTFTDAKYELRKVKVEYTPPGPKVSAVHQSSEDVAIAATNLAGNDSFGDAISSDDEFDASLDDEDDEEKSTDEPKKDDAKAEEPKKSPATTSEKPAETKSTPETKPDTAKPDQQKPTTAESTDTEKDDKTETKPAATTETPPVTLAERDPFNDGLRSELTFSSEITTSTAEAYLLAELKKLDDKKYVEPEALFRITGTSGSGVTAKEGQVRIYDKMLLETRTNEQAGVTVQAVAPEDLAKALEAMQKTLATTPIFEEVSNFASSVAEDMRYLAVLALLASGAATVVYLWFRFTKADFGIAAVVAVFHDVMFVLACLPMAYYLNKTPLGPLLALDDFKLNLSIVAAFLTIIGYSLNDTIVIFDRVRELRGRNPLLTPQMINDSVNQTLSRTILTATTVFITVAILYFIGGEGIHGFAFCMLVGTLVGSYSTVFIASPFLLWMMNREQQKQLASRK